MIEAGEPRGVVVIHHGLADHSDRYAGFAERLVHAGYTVWAFDMRSHGRSAGARVQIDRIDDLLEDLDAFVALVASASRAARSCCTATAWTASPPRCMRSNATGVDVWGVALGGELWGGN